MNEETLLSRMTLQERIGQLLMAGFHGTEVPEELRSLIAEGRIGGVILFARNVESPAQTARLTASLQRIAREAGVPPLWISIDQEGGMVARLTEGVALMPGNMALGATEEPALAYEAASIAGRELRALGINMNYAPVLDVNNNAANPVIGVRSYGESPERVAAFGAEAVRGYAAAGVAAAAKHFPGHGDTSVDSHLDLPLVGHDRARLDAVELAPFRRAIAAGVDLIMTAHVRFPAIEPGGLPATLSPAVLTGLLRGELGFEGLITTDCMEMKAIANYYGTPEACVLAVAAGADQVLVSHTLELQRGALAAIEAAVRGGRIPAERIEAAARRSLRLKAAHGVLDAAASEAASASALAEVGCAAHLAVARDISERSVTLVRERGVLPLRRERTLAVTVAAAAQTIADEAVRASAGLGAALSALGLDCRDECVDASPSDARIAELSALAREGGWAQLVVGVYNAAFHPAQGRLVQALQASGLPLVVVALRNPYDLAAFPDADACVAVYENRPLALASAAKALLGVIPFRGALPVSLGEAYPAGWKEALA